MGSPIYQVDAFTGEAFAGNPAAVVVLTHGTFEDGEQARWMQRVAGEMNLSETAFVWPIGGEAGTFGLRWFTPAAEVALCGHATLAAAHVLWSRGDAGHYAGITFQTRWSGALACRRAEDERIALALPIDPPVEAALPDGLIAALGVDGSPARTAKGRYDWLVELADEAAVRRASPDFSKLAEYEGRGVVITAPADASRAGDDASSEAAALDVVSRFFAPRLRVAEDPVTGSVHALLGPYWAKRLGRSSLEAAQCSPRGGRLGVTVEADSVTLVGAAVTVLAGELLA